jgi:hypothetical protein
MNSNQQKIKKLLDEAEAEVEESVSRVVEAGNSFLGKYSSVLNKIDNILRSKCKAQYEWLEANTTQTPEGPKPKDKSKAEEFKNNLEDFGKCVDKNDLGSQQIMSSFAEDMNKISEKSTLFYQNCLKSNDDSQIKECFKKMFIMNAKEFDNFYSNYNTKFDELNNKL